MGQEIQMSKIKKSKVDEKYNYLSYSFYKFFQLTKSQDFERAAKLRDEIKKYLAK